MLISNFVLPLLSLAIGVSSVQAHPVLEGSAPESIVYNHIELVQEKTVELASVIGKWNGDIIEALKITTASEAVLGAIDDGTTATKGLKKKLSVSQAIRVKTATKQLLAKITESLETITGAKKHFEDAGLTSIMVSKLGETKEAAESFIGAVVEKLPAGKGIGRRLGKKISAEFDKALAKFSAEPPNNTFAVAY